MEDYLNTKETEVFSPQFNTKILILNQNVVLLNEIKLKLTKTRQRCFLI